MLTDFSSAKTSSHLLSYMQEKVKANQEEEEQMICNKIYVLQPFGPLRCTGEVAGKPSQTFLFFH